MGGFPLVNGLAIAALLCAALFPLMALTGRGTVAALPPAPAPATAASSGRPARATLKFAHRPEAVALRHLERVLWSQDRVDANELEVGLLLPAFEPGEGIDLLLEVRWPDGSPETAVELILEPEALEGRSGTAWGTGELAEVLAFVWPEELP